VLTEIDGVRVGHWTDPVARTGCTVVLFPEGTVASGEVRGGAPATRDFALLAPEALVARLDAVVLSGGSAFGLAAADGVMQLLADGGVGLPTGAGPVPIVVGLSLFDLLVGDGSVRPRAVDGHVAAEVADDGPVALGAVGAGTGATVGKWLGPDHITPGGLGGAAVHRGPVVVAALVAVNAFGDIDDGSVPDRLAGGLASYDAVRAHERLREPGGPDEPPGEPLGDPERAFGLGASPGQHTTIGVVATNARLDKVGCLLLAQGGHDAIARTLVPAHTRVDGDALVAAATGAVEPAVTVDELRLLATIAVEQAIRTVNLASDARAG
jgi:L-aminopeptidase/D-esterase-like protein